MRQFPSRETFHAGQNSLDKGIRYFNTVIVTADADWKLRAISNHLATITVTFNIPALVRLQPLYILLRVKQGPVFLINSRLEIFRCDPSPCGSG